MNSHTYLKRQLSVYIISGVIAGLAVFSLITIHRYNDHLSEVLGKVRSIEINRHKVGDEIERSDALSDYLRYELDQDIAGADSEQLMFRALDRMKSKFREAGLSVSMPEDKGGTKELPVNIDATVEGYKVIVDYVAYIESFRIPAYKIKSMSISGNPAGGLVLDIKGSLVIPVL